MLILRFFGFVSFLFADLGDLSPYSGLIFPSNLFIQLGFVPVIIIIIIIIIIIVTVIISIIIVIIIIIFFFYRTSQLECF